MTQAAFWDRAARRYAARPVGNEAAYERTLERTRAHLHPGQVALELGCGTGTTALKLAGSVGRYVGTDISGEMIAIAREKGAPDHVRFDRAGVEEAGRGEVPDVVLAFNLFHLLDDMPGALARVHGMLAPGGLLISKTPCLGPQRWLFAPLIGAMRLIGKAPRVQMLHAGELEAAIRAAGFAIVETGDYPAGPQSRFVVARKA